LKHHIVDQILGHSVIITSTLSWCRKLANRSVKQSWTCSTPTNPNLKIASNNSSQLSLLLKSGLGNSNHLRTLEVSLIRMKEK